MCIRRTFVVFDSYAGSFAAFGRGKRIESTKWLEAGDNIVELTMQFDSGDRELLAELEKQSYQERWATL